MAQDALNPAGDPPSLCHPPPGRVRVKARILHTFAQAAVRAGPAQEEAKRMRKRSITTAGVCALMLATGCATSGTVEKLEDRVGALEQRVDDAERKASAAQEAAERASADARNASESMKRADAMFQKSVTK